MVESNFPSITFCNANPYKLSAVQAIPELEALVFFMIPNIWQHHKVFSADSILAIIITRQDVINSKTLLQQLL